MLDRPKRKPLAERPRAGDTAKNIDKPHSESVVTDTFYRNGEGGMHVYWAEGQYSWACCDRVEIVQRGPMWDRGELPE